MSEVEKDCNDYLEKYCKMYGLTLEEGKQEALFRETKAYYEQRGSEKIM